LILDLLTSGSVHAEVLPSIENMSTDFGADSSQAISLLERGQTDRRDWTPYTTLAAIQPAWVITSKYSRNLKTYREPWK